MENSKLNLRAAYVAYETVQNFKHGDIIRCKPWMNVHNHINALCVFMGYVKNPVPETGGMGEPGDIRVGVFDTDEDGDFITFPVNSKRFELAE